MYPFGGPAVVRRPSLSSVDGSGSILGVAIVAATVCGVLLITGILAAVLIVVRLQNAADSASIAAADAQRGLTAGVPCELAQHLVNELDFELSQCKLVDVDMQVGVRGTVLGFNIERIAKAGPPE